MENNRCNPKLLAAGLILSGALTMTGCGGSSGGNTPETAPAQSAAPITLSGTAAGGAAIAGGTVNVKCATGTGTATTAADGTYTLTLTGIAPCMLQVTDPNNAANVFYSAVQVGTTTANITPLTSLIVANAIGADPATAYTSFSSTTASNITTSTLSAAVTNVSTALATSLNITIPSGTNPLTVTFTAATETTTGSALDKAIDALVSSLAAANVPLSTLTTAVASSTSVTAATTAVANAAAASNIATSALSNCPYAPSGPWLVATMGARSFKTVNLDFSKMTGVGGVAEGSPNYTITQMVDSSNNPITCAFQITSSSTTDPFSMAFRVSQSGVAAGGAIPTATASPTNILLSALNFGMAVPQQSTIKLADLAGTWNIVSLAQGTLTSPWNTWFGQGVRDSSGSGQTYTCSGGLTCATSATWTSTLAQDSADPNGIFTSTRSDGTVRKVAAYRSPSGDMIELILGPSGTTSGDDFGVASQRVSPLPLRAVNSTWTSNVWVITNASDLSGGLQQNARLYSFTVNSITSNSYTRTDSISSVTDVVNVDDPRPYMQRRPAIAATSTQNGLAEWIMVTGLGWGVFATTGTGGPTTNPVYWGVGIVQVE